MPRVEFRYGRCAGIEAWEQHTGQGQVIYLAPVTSKGEIGRCNTQIPVEDVDQVIEALQKVKMPEPISIMDDSYGYVPGR